MNRTLTPILAADIVGYAQMMRDNADATLTKLTRVRSQILGPIVSANRGRVLKSMGDGWLVAFPAAHDAVECAMRLQDRLKEDGMVLMRLGIHLGDLTETEEDIFGDGVNVASRLQRLAKPGALAISGASYEMLDGTLRPSFQNAGRRKLKSINDPVRVWVRGGEIAGGQIDMAAHALPNLAIMPVACKDPREELQDLASALTGDLDAHLNVLRYLNSKTNENPAAEDYQLHSTLRVRGDRSRIEARLIAPTGTTVFSHKIDGVLNDTFDWQDETALALAEYTFENLIEHEVRQFQHLSEAECTAPQLMQRMLVIGATDGPGIGRMTHLMSLAIEKEPTWGAAYAMAVGLMLLAQSNGTLGHVRQYAPKLLDWSQQIDALEPAFSHARIILSLGDLVRTGKYDQAQNDVRLVMRNLPFDPETLHWAAWVYNFSGAPHDALVCLDQADRTIRPKFAAPSFLTARSMAMLLLHDYEAALVHAEAALDLCPHDVGAHIMSASAYVRLGNTAAAQTSIATVAQLSPDFSMRTAGWRDATSYPERIHDYYDGLRLAGLPD